MSLSTSNGASKIDVAVIEPNGDGGARARAMIRRETQLQRLVTAYIATGLLFLLLPGTFLGVWNLLSISAEHPVDSLSPAWLQAHGHAQIFGWLGTFILGIGFYSLSKMGKLPAFAISRGWTCYALWTAGVALRWSANVTGWQWKTLVPVSALLELGGFLLFFATVAGHKAQPAEPKAEPRLKGADASLQVKQSPKKEAQKKEAWMMVVIASTFGFLAALVANVATAIYAWWSGDSPAVPLILDQRLLSLPLWGFLIPTVWGFNGRWLPVFLGVRAPRATPLYAAVITAWLSIAAMLAGHSLVSALLMPVAAAFSITALGVFQKSVQPPKLNGVHKSFPVFVRIAYVWLIVGSLISIAAALADRAGGIWGASRHALTVGFLGVMVFSIGPKVLPAFCGMRVLYSPRLMFASLTLLNVGCLLRVCSEINAYEGYAHHAWSVLPVSAMTELTAVAIFVANMVATLLRPPAHLMAAQGR